MKKSALVLKWVLGLFSVVMLTAGPLYAQGNEMTADSETQLEINAVMQGWYNAYVGKDIQGVMSSVAADDDIVFYGSAGEKAIGYDAVKQAFQKDFASFDSASFTMPWIHISNADNIAWVAVDLDMQIWSKGNGLHFQARHTAVLEKRGDMWLIVQSHYSVPAPEEMVQVEEVKVDSTVTPPKPKGKMPSESGQ